jgi:hypothetical protein
MTLPSSIFSYIAVFLLVFAQTSVNEDEIALTKKIATLADKVYRAEEPHSPHKLVEFTLANGMQICLQPCEKEKNEFHFQLFAPGGFTSLPPEERALGWTSSKVAWESGINGQTTDEFTFHLVDHNAAMRITTHIFGRAIEASGPISELPYCLHIAKLFLSEPQFTEEGLKHALKRALSTLDKKSKKGNSKGLRDIFLLTNMHNWDILQPNSPEDFKDVSLAKIESIFKKLYSNPAEFHLALAGDIDTELVTKQIEETLGSLPKTSQYLTSLPPIPPFPNGLKKEFFGYSRYQQSLTRLTFPLSKDVDLQTLDLLCAHLNRKIKLLLVNADSLKKEMTINYEFPLFPSLDVLWLEIQFSCPKSQIEPYSRLILKALEKVQNEIEESDIALSMTELKRRRSIPLDLTGELLVLSNYCRSGRNKDNLYTTKYDEKVMSKKIKDCYPNVSNYSMITLHP